MRGEQRPLMAVVAAPQADNQQASADALIELSELMRAFVLENVPDCPDRQELLAWATRLGVLGAGRRAPGPGLRLAG